MEPAAADTTDSPRVGLVRKSSRKTGLIVAFPHPALAPAVGPVGVINQNTAYAAGSLYPPATVLSQAAPQALASSRTRRM
jgi:hypothetical protein